MNKVYVVLENQCDVTEEISLSTLNLAVFIGICKIGKLHQKWHWSTLIVRESFWAAELTIFKYPFDTTTIKIIIPLYNTIRTIVFESRETLWIALYLSVQRNISHNIACRYSCCFQEYILFGWCIKNDKWMWCNPMMFKCRVIDSYHIVWKRCHATNCNQCESKQLWPQFSLS